MNSCILLYTTEKETNFTNFRKCYTMSISLFSLENIRFLLRQLCFRYFKSFYVKLKIVSHSGNQYSLRKNALCSKVHEILKKS